MILDFVTITGADDKVDLQFLEDMMIQYPHVEWGILISESRRGTPRYPSREWIKELADEFYPKFDTSFSGHLCGSICERLIRDQDFQTLADNVPPIFTRLQLNSFPELYLLSDNVNAVAAKLRNSVEIVLPMPNGAVITACKKPFLANVAFLHDGSRGLGISPNMWSIEMLNKDVYVGFAGGINPDNIREVLDALCGRRGNRRFWLDLESGARTDDLFDPKKVEKVLQISEEYLG